jgi:hypothetical protein
VSVFLTTISAGITVSYSKMIMIWDYESPKSSHGDHDHDLRLQVGFGRIVINGND